MVKADYGSALLFRGHLYIMLILARGSVSALFNVYVMRVRKRTKHELLSWEER
jgi:hypothetical protein